MKQMPNKNSINVMSELIEKFAITICSHFYSVISQKTLLLSSK